VWTLNLTQDRLTYRASLSFYKPPFGVACPGMKGFVNKFAALLFLIVLFCISGLAQVTAKASCMPTLPSRSRNQKEMVLCGSS